MSAAAGVAGGSGAIASLMPPAIVADGVAKAFGPVRANRAASLRVARGEIHAVVGENGAGKSTLMRMLAGMYTPDAGRIEVDGRDVTGWGTREAIAAGVGMVHQHFMLVPTLTVAENLVLGQELTRGLQLDRHAAEQAVEALCQRTGLVVDPRRRVADLTVGESQRVEILKVLYRGAKILILDEPTAVLSPPEVGELWRVLRRLTSEGGTVVLITHKLDEVVAISDHITVMRAGETVGRLVTREATPASIAKLMVGRDVRLVGSEASIAAPGIADGGAVSGATGGAGDAPRAAPGAQTSGAGASERRDVALSVSRLVVASARKPNEVDDVSFDLMAGEILGIAGVEGNGQTELVEAIAGLRHASAGTISLGQMALGALPVHRRSDAGLSHIPEDRHRRALVLDYDVADNLILGLQHQFSRRGVLDAPRIAINARERISEFDIRPPVPALPAAALSGGNQQKIVVAREMHGREFTVLLAAQPTRGVDVGAIEFIHARLRAARDAGKAVLLVSADLAEVLALSDRVAVMYEGKIVVTLDRTDATADVIGSYMTGASRTGEFGAIPGHEARTTS